MSLVGNLKSRFWARHFAAGEHHHRVGSCAAARDWWHSTASIGTAVCWILSSQHKSAL